MVWILAPLLFACAHTREKAENCGDAAKGMIHCRLHYDNHEYVEVDYVSRDPGDNACGNHEPLLSDEIVTNSKYLPEIEQVEEVDKRFFGCCFDSFVEYGKKYMMVSYTYNEKNLDKSKEQCAQHKGKWNNS